MSIILFCLILFPACGYKSGSSRSLDTGRIGSLAIPVFENSSFELSAGTVFTSSVRNVFARRGDFQLKQEGKASYILRGRVVSIEEEAAILRSAASSSRVGMYEMKAEIELKLFDSTQTLISSTRIIDKIDFMGGQYPSDIKHNREAAMMQLAENMMIRAHNKLFEGF